MKNEQWKAVPEYEGLYEASDFGRIRSLDRFEEYFDRGYFCRRARRGRIIQQHANRGYMKVLLSKDGKVKLWPVHQLVCLTFNGARPDGMQTAHMNGVKADNRPANLKWATAKENMGHQAVHGTRRIGERSPRAKLTAAKVEAIRMAVTAGSSYTEQARLYGVAIGSISAAAQRRTWAHV